MTELALLQTQTQRAFWQQQHDCAQTIQQLLTHPTTPAIRESLQQLLTQQQQLQETHYAFLRQLPALPETAAFVTPAAPPPAVARSGAPRVAPPSSILPVSPAAPPVRPSGAPRPLVTPSAPTPVVSAPEPSAPGPSAPVPAQPPSSAAEPAVAVPAAPVPQASAPAASPSQAPEAPPLQAPSIENRTIRPRHRVEFWLFQQLKRWAEQAHPRTRRWVQKGLEALLWHSQARRKVVDRNLELAFPEWSVAERNQLARQNYQWFVRFSLDVLQMGAWQGRANEWVDFTNLDVLDAALEEQRGVLMVGGHFGNWEYLCPALSERGYATTMYVGRQTNPLSDRLQNEERLRSGIQTIGKGRTATSDLMAALRHNRAVGMLVDQDERSSGVFVDFFGHPASSSRGAAAFHLLQKSPVVLFTCAYVGSRVEITFERIAFSASGVTDQDVPVLTARIQQALERRIRQHPEQYFWMHRRWRTRPPGQPGLYDGF